MRPLRVAARHLLMHDAAARGHPLHVAGAEHALVAEAVAVIDLAGQDIGDRLDAAMRMPGEAGLVLVGIVVAEIVQQQERIELLVSPKPKARRRCTPAPSSVGLDWMIFFTGRMDMMLCSSLMRADSIGVVTRPRRAGPGRARS